MIDDITKFVQMYNDKDTYPSIKLIAKEFKVSDRAIRKMAEKCRNTGIKLIDRQALNNAKSMKPEEQNVVLSETDHIVTDVEVQTENVKLAKRLQLLQDKNRIANKAFRDVARNENALVELNEHLIEEIKKLKLSHAPKYHEKKECEHYGIVHWSDQHLNEQVDLPWNKFDWKVASKRLQKHVKIIKKMCKTFNINHVLVAMTGDLLNSDRRLDELMSNAGNRSQACLLAVDLYQQALLDLNEDVNVTVASVSGNESRIPLHVGWDKLVASENYDFTIAEILKRLLDSKGIKFFEGTDPSEVVVDLGGQKVLLLHSHGAIDHKAPLKTVQQLKGRYMAHGIHIDMVIFGHVHEALIGDYYGRSSSLVGTNDYAEKSLGLSGRASQNFYILSSLDKGFHGLKIDLQDTTNVEGYNIQKQLESYNTKSSIKAGKTMIVQKVEL